MYYRSQCLGFSHTSTSCANFRKPPPTPFKKFMDDTSIQDHWKNQRFSDAIYHSWRTCQPSTQPTPFFYHTIQTWKKNWFQVQLVISSCHRRVQRLTSRCRIATCFLCLYRLTVSNALKENSIWLNLDLAPLSVVGVWRECKYSLYLLSHNKFCKFILLAELSVLLPISL